MKRKFRLVLEGTIEDSMPDDGDNFDEVDLKGVLVDELRQWMPEIVAGLKYTPEPHTGVVIEKEEFSLDPKE